MATKAEVVNTLVDDDGSVDDTVLPGQPHHPVHYPDEAGPLLVHGDIAQVTHMSILSTVLHSHWWILGRYWALIG